MSNMEKYITVFKESFGISGDSEVAVLEYQAIPAWDSVGHMRLISGLEDTFNIMMDTDDIIDFRSFEKGKTILEKYEVVF